jgi:hypothetical protein
VKVNPLQLQLAPVDFDAAEMFPVHLRLLSRRRFESPYGHPLRRLALQLQPIFDNRVTARISVASNSRNGTWAFQTPDTFGSSCDRIPTAG